MHSVFCPFPFNEGTRQCGILLHLSDFSNLKSLIFLFLTPAPFQQKMKTSPVKLLSRWGYREYVSGVSGRKCKASEMKPQKHIPSVRRRPVVHGFDSQSIGLPHSEINTWSHSNDASAVKTSHAILHYNIHITKLKGDTIKNNNNNA